jgi:uncharacterized protein YbaR (Trm112 family)
MIDSEFLKLLRCPETGQPLKIAEAPMVRALNERIAAGRLRNRGGDKVEQPCDGGLIREDGRYLYPIRAEIPVMLIAQSLPIQEPD